MVEKKSKYSKDLFVTIYLAECLNGDFFLLPATLHAVINQEFRDTLTLNQAAVKEVFLTEC